MSVRPLPFAALAAALLAAAPARAERHLPRGPALLDAPAVLQSAPPPTHRIPLSVVILSGSGWARDVVERRVEMTRTILGQCGIDLRAKVVERKAPSGSARVVYDRERSAEPSGMGTLARALRPDAGPTMFYIGGFEDNPGQGGTSRPPFSSAGTPEVDTAWLPFFERPPSWQDAYHVDAHELVHVLGDTGHSVLPTTGSVPRRRKEDPPDPASMDGGLMAGNPAIRSNRLAPALCEKMKEHPFAQGL